MRMRVAAHAPWSMVCQTGRSRRFSSPAAGHTHSYFSLNRVILLPLLQAGPEVLLGTCWSSPHVHIKHGHLSQRGADPWRAQGHDFRNKMKCKADHRTWNSSPLEVDLPAVSRHHNKILRSSHANEHCINPVLSSHPFPSSKFLAFSGHSTDV